MMYKGHMYDTTTNKKLIFLFLSLMYSSLVIPESFEWQKHSFAQDSKTLNDSGSSCKTDGLFLYYPTYSRTLPPKKAVLPLLRWRGYALPTPSLSFFKLWTSFSCILQFFFSSQLQNSRLPNQHFNHFITTTRGKYRQPIQLTSILSLWVLLRCLVLVLFRKGRLTTEKPTTVATSESLNDQAIRLII